MEIENFFSEHKHKELLHGHLLTPRHKILFAGPPGNGKTSLAEAIANHMEIPFYVVNYATLLGKYLGESPARLDKIFNFAAGAPCVLFFDEFEMVGRKRYEDNDVREISRVVTLFLTKMDKLPSHTIIICATNLPKKLDSAIADRFQICLELAPPTALQATKYIKMLCQRHGLSIDMEKVSQCESFREIEHQVQDFMRQAILGPEENKEVA